jgi:hypothetical protein
MYYSLSLKLKSKTLFLHIAIQLLQIHLRYVLISACKLCASFQNGV